MSNRNWLRLTCVTILMSSGFASTTAAQTQGPHRLICPPCSGVPKIADLVYADVGETRRDRILAMRNEADRIVARFFGSLKSKPIWLIASKSSTLRKFTWDERGTEAAGVTFGWFFIRIAPNGLRQSVFTHERVHAELHHRLGLFGLFRRNVPTWFDEGLAVLLAKEGNTGFRQRRPRRSDRRPWLREADTDRKWHRILNRHGVVEVYRAAAYEVFALEQKFGRPGLQRIVMHLTDGKPLASAIKAVADTP